MRSQRRRELLRILREGHASTQRDIAAALHASGYDVTQATVSRDLKEIGATKLTVHGEPVYRLPDELPRTPGGDLMARNLMRTLAEFAIEITPAASLVVVSTAPGHAAAVARAIDMADVDEVIGTVAGDDTIFVATPGAIQAEGLGQTWQDAMAPATANHGTEVL